MLRKTRRTKRNYTNRLGPYTNTHPALKNGCRYHDKMWIGCRHCEQLDREREQLR